MASETEREESNQEIEDPQSTVGGEEEKVVVEEQEEAADEEKIPDEEERVGEDEGDPSEDDEEEKSGVVKFEGGVVKGEEVVEGEKKKKKQSLKEKGAVPRTPTSERPSRERKTVERYTETVSARSSASKPVSVVKGRGTQLKDIPNVAFKLSKRKADETLQMLHAILFGKKGKVQMLKRNISMFSGFAWDENEEEKQRAKVKEKLDKCVKEKLLDFVDILNIPVSRSAIKKEELSAKLLEFLEAPHVTTDSLLAEKEKSKKRKAKGSVSKSSGSSGAASRKSRKKKEKDSPAGEKHKQPSKSEVEEVDDKSEHSESADESMEDADNDVVAQMGIDEKQNDAKGKDEVEEEEEEEEPKKQLQSSKTAKKKVKRDSGDKDQEKSLPVTKEIQEKSSKSPAKSPKTSSIYKSKTPASEADSAFKVSSANHGKLEKEKKKDPSNSKKVKVSRKKQTSDATKAFGKDQGKAKSSKPAKAEPTTAEMHEVVAHILREVDFNTATLSDILTQVGTHFGVDLSHRKSEVKGIITEVINNMSDEEEEDDNDNDDDDDDDDDGDDKTRENQGNDEDDNDDSV